MLIQKPPSPLAFTTVDFSVNRPSGPFCMLISRSTFMNMIQSQGIIKTIDCFVDLPQAFSINICLKFLRTSTKQLYSISFFSS